MSFPVATSMDRFNATKVGDPLPPLGQAILEDAESMKLRKKGGKIEWSTDYVYTMALWSGKSMLEFLQRVFTCQTESKILNRRDSAYADWSDWQILNFPGIRPCECRVLTLGEFCDSFTLILHFLYYPTLVSITSMVGVQPIKLTLYSQLNLDREVIISMEVSHAKHATLGTEAKRWIADNVDRGKAPFIDSIECSENETVNGNESHAEEEDLAEQFDDDEKCNEDLDVDDALESDDDQTGDHVMSGTPIALREGISNYVANGGGYAVLQSNPPPFSYFVLDKKMTKKKKGVSGSTAAIRSGDVVRVQLVDAISKDVKYLAIHRGWWLRWSTVKPTRNGLFCIRVSDANGSIVGFGCPFSLASQRWPQYTIGACVESSAKYGGRMLGISKTEKISVGEDVGGYPSEDDGQSHDNELDVADDVVEKSRDKRMMPLLLCAEAFPSPLTLTPMQTPNVARNLFTGDTSRVPNPETTSSTEPSVQPAQKEYEVDVPVWLEMMNRTQRKMQLVYVVRFKKVQPEANEESRLDSETESFSTGDNQGTALHSRMFLKLRTGRDLAPILRLGIDGNEQAIISPSSDQWQQRCVSMMNDFGYDIVLWDIFNNIVLLHVCIFLGLTRIIKTTHVPLAALVLTVWKILMATMMVATTTTTKTMMYRRNMTSMNRIMAIKMMMIRSYYSASVRLNRTFRLSRQ